MTSGTQTLLFEIGTEEIPAFDLQAATKQFGELVPRALDDARIPRGDVKVYSSPRRLAAVVSDVAAQTQAVDEECKGPSVKIAFDDAGNPTKAAEGFARGKGVDVSALEVRDDGGTDYVFACKSIPSSDVASLLPDVLKGVIEAISWPKSMKWGSHRELFSRPVRWIAAMLGDEVVELSYAGVASSDFTMGHRVLAPGRHKIPSADRYESVVRAAFVVPTERERRALIEENVRKAEQDNPGCTAVLPAKTLAEVVNLSEYPTVLVGSFDEEFLKVPEEITVDAMLMHQRYFPLYRDGSLTNRFIIVSNGDPAYSDNVIDGNERVVAARLYDAKFFYEEDLKVPLEGYVERLDEVVFQEKLGTMRAKTDRVVQLSEKLCMDAAVSDAEADMVARAAKLAKADLVTNAVVEFTSVQGVMGSYYAAAAGEDERVAQAIADHYRPRFAGDEPPADLVGRMVALADKVDTICGLFAIGQAPTGSSDPFALRRAALGVIAILRAGLDVSLDAAIDASLSIYREGGLDFDVAAVRGEVVDFFSTRTKVMLHEAGNDVGTIDAVLAAGVVEPTEVVRRTEALTAAIKESPELFDDLASAYARANNLRDAKLGEGVDAALFDESEQRLSHAIDEVSTQVAESLQAGDYPQALEGLAGLRGPIDDFFESTMVMDDDARIRENRIRLLNRFVGVFSNIADFSLIQHKRK